ncbi:acetoacetate--CoA ligase [Ancylobacter defluvii]|uniref:Acetoacetyl-coenzyme A synthetase n=1 Tax=Ancylobacter defluvii TaxID=1282440 RepID=A0A9W6JWB2_9HYPH|nr:acetoacetate--CoA ligase [Ancylobacter defluvii]MBS7589391.1 acetoacetate--CoA ligase [Ancylobacter defluvii]GLK85006.1 acetoacetyl-coenzyme A synthetase [Ancylobacter defluvii]
MSADTDLPLWTPSEERVARTAVVAFIRTVNQRHGTALASYRDLHAWSIAEPAAFWEAVWELGEVIGERSGPALVDGGRMPGAAFFPQARLNYAENLLRPRDPASLAMVFRGEDKVERHVSFGELTTLVSRLQQAMKAAGVGIGDRVAATMPNLPETIAIMLAATSLGAIFSSCSPDFGERGILDRFSQIAPKLYFACDGYWYSGKRVGIGDKLRAVVPHLDSAVTTVIVPYLGEAEEVAGTLPNGASLDSFIAPFESAPLTFERVPFNHPVFILFSSGTTGVPKCIVHGGGGTLLQHIKEHRLQCDLHPGDRLFYFTTCGWMMWNWLVTGLASGLTLCLFDGSPFAPKPSVLFDYAEQEGFALFGTSAKYIDSLRKEGLRPVNTHDLSKLKALTSTGSPLAPADFAYVYEAIKSDLHLASISGGTDIVSCFVLGDPTAPVYRGEIQAPGLGMAIEVWSDDGKPVVGERGELVCTRPFPCMPVMFWNDPEGTKYHAAYFERFDNIWCHGDFAEWTAHGGIIIHGRSDATLNPQGVRIGTAEIYAQAEQVPEILEAIAIGQEWDNDVRVVLFVRLKAGAALDVELEKRIKTQIRVGASPRHVPAKIVAVTDIPRTRSGKITELAVREVVHGRPVKNTEALANPEALDLYRNLPELAS